MMIEEVLLTIAQTVFMGMLVFYLQRKQNRTDEKRDKLEEAKRKESLLELEMLMASAKLSYAVAMAIKRGTPNGEVEEGVKAYNEAHDHYTTFIETQVKNYLD